MSTTVASTNDGSKQPASTTSKPQQQQKQPLQEQSSQQLFRKAASKGRLAMAFESDSVAERSRVKNFVNANNIQFVHYTGDTHFEPSKLSDVKLYPVVDPNDRRQESVVRLDLLDVKEGVYDKLETLGPRLHSLSIRDLSLGYVPKELQPIWPNIRALDLSGNSLNEFTLSDTLPMLTNLSELSLNRNNLQQLPSTFRKLKHLRRLFLSHNKLIGVSNLDASHLQWFVADGNGLQSIDSFLVSSSCDRALQVLDVSHNQLTALPGSIRNFRCLVDLDISNNNIRLLPLEIFKLQSLQFLNASCNRISHIPSFSTQSPAFSKSQLRSIDLSENVLSKMPEHLMFLADRVDVACNFIKFIRGNLLQKIAFSSKKQLRVEGNPLLFPPASLVGTDGLRGLLSFFSAIKNKVKRRKGMKVFIVGGPNNGKSSFVKTVIDEFPHIADEPTVMACSDEFFVDIDAPGELGQLLSSGSTSGAENSNANSTIDENSDAPSTTVEKIASDLFMSSNTPTSVSSSTSSSAHVGHRHLADGSCCDSRKDEEENLDSNLDSNRETSEMLRELAIRKRMRRPRSSMADVMEVAPAPPPQQPVQKPTSDPASQWKCIQLPVLDISARGIFSTLRRFFLEDYSIVAVVFDISTFPTPMSASSPTVKEWYREKIGLFLDEVFVLCKEACVMLVGSYVDKTDDVDAKCSAVLSMVSAHRQQRIDAMTSQLQAIDQKGQITMADQEKMLLLKNLLAKQKVRVSERIIRFSSQVEGNFSSAVLANFVDLLKMGAAQGEALDPFFKPALEPITNLHSDIIEYIEILATSMRFPIVETRVFEDIFFKEYQIISEQVVRRIPRFLHQVGHIFWSLRNQVLSELVVLRPEFLHEFLVALFAFIFDEKHLQSALVNIQDCGRRLFQLAPNDVRDATMRFVKTGLLNTFVGEMVVRKNLNIKTTEILQSTLVNVPIFRRYSNDAGELVIGDPTETSGNKGKGGISSAPIHMCVEKFCVGFGMAYAFDSDSLEYATLYNPKIAEIDMANPRVGEPIAFKQQAATPAPVIPTVAPNKGQESQNKKAVSFATSPTMSKKWQIALGGNKDSSEPTVVKRSQSPSTMKEGAETPPASDRPNSTTVKRSQSPGAKQPSDAAQPNADRHNSIAAKRSQSPGLKKRNSIIEIPLDSSEPPSTTAKRAPSPALKHQPSQSSLSLSQQPPPQTPRQPPTPLVDDKFGFFLKFPKTAKPIPQPSSGSFSCPCGKNSPSPSIGPGGRSPSIASSALTPDARFLLFPALRPPTLPDAYRLAIADAWDTLSPDMWIGAALTFPTNYYPPSAFHEIICRAREKVQFLEFGYVWQKGAFGKFVNTASGFVKILHHSVAPMDCDVRSLLLEHDHTQPGDENSPLLRNSENTITIELRTSSDVPSPESAKLNEIAGFSFSEKSLPDYVMNLWERLYEILEEVENYCNGFAALLVERRVLCPFCKKFSFVGEWTSPRELQAFHEKPCPTCGKFVDTAYLVQPKSCQRELCERIMKDIQKRRAANILKNPEVAKSDSSDDSSSTSSNSDGEGTFGRILEEDDEESTTLPPRSRQQQRSAAPSGNNNGSGASSKTKKAARMMADHGQLLTMMTSHEK